MTTKTRFKDLNIGDTFDFIGPVRMFNSFTEPCRKVSSVHYVAMLPSGEDNPKYGKMRIGSFKCEVYHVGRKAS